MGDIYKSQAGKDHIMQAYRRLLDDWPVPYQERYLDTSQGQTFAIESGSSESPTVLLLHGSVSNSLTWMGDVEALSKHHHVFAVDLIGEAGFSAPQRPDYASGAYAQWLHEIITGLDDRPVALIGMSLGGWMCLEYATTHPDNVSQLCLLCPGGVIRESKSFLLKALFYMLCGQWGKNRISKLINGGKLPNDEGMRQALDFVSLVGKHFKPRTAQLPLFADEALQKLTMPVLALCGEADALIPPVQTLERLGRFVPNIQAILLEGTGHAISSQSKRLAEFLSA